MSKLLKCASAQSEDREIYYSVSESKSKGKDAPAHRPRLPPATVDKDNNVQILLIGKTGNGKSSLGNRILGNSKSVFKVSTGILSATTHTQLGETVRGHKNEKVQVVDFPDVFDCDLDEDDRKKEADLCKALTFPFPTVVCLVVRADVRFTPEEYDNYQKTKKLLDRRVTDNMVVVFTMADRLDSEQRDHFDQQLKQASEQIHRVLQNAKDRYVLVSNKDQQDGVDSQKAGQEDGVSKLLDLAVDIGVTQRSACTSLRAILLGATGSGKSATGNSILFNINQPPPFDEHMGIAATDASGSVKKATMAMRGFQIEILDTPGLHFGSNHVEHHEDLVRTWFQKSSPDVIIYVINSWRPFNELNMEMLNVVKKLVEREEEAYSRLILVFTCGDKLKKNHTDIGEQLAKAPESLKNLLKGAMNRYLLFDNKTKSDTQARLLQRNRLLEMMEKVANANAGKPLEVTDDHQNTLADRSVRDHRNYNWCTVS